MDKLQAKEKKIDLVTHFEEVNDKWMCAFVKVTKSLKLTYNALVFS